MAAKGTTTAVDSSPPLLCLRAISRIRAVLHPSFDFTKKKKKLDPPSLMAHDSYQPAIFAFSGHGQQLESFISITEPGAWVDQPRHLLEDDATMRSFFPTSPDVEEHPTHGLSLSFCRNSQPPLARFRNHSFQSEKFFPESAAPTRSAVSEYGSQLGRLMACKYLTSAQQLLSELCSLGGEDLGVRSKQNSLLKRREKGGGTSYSSSASNYNFLQSLDILELQKRKAKLMVLLEEVDRRYKRYDEQMRAVVWPFEAEAGGGAAELYLALASKAISVHFRRLKDGILAQMQGVKKAMGDKCPVAVGGKTPRLKLLDQCFRQRNAFRNCGLIDHHPWRPQRGLPERSVSILRAWLFEHFLHPYPNDIDKHILARQTGLFRSQVSNWFINARVRLWKPMIEEMYAEEFKDWEAPQPAGDEADGCGSKANANPNSKKGDEAQRSPMVGYEETSGLDSLCSVVGLHRRSDALPVIDNGFSSYNGYGSREGFRGNGVSLTLGLQQNNGGMDLSFSTQQNLLLDCQAVRFPILEAEVDDLPYRNMMRAELLHDLAR